MSFLWALFSSTSVRTTETETMMMMMMMVYFLVIRFCVLYHTSSWLVKTAKLFGFCTWKSIKQCKNSLIRWTLKPALSIPTDATTARLTHGWETCCDSGLCTFLTTSHQPPDPADFFFTMSDEDASWLGNRQTITQIITYTLRWGKYSSYDPYWFFDLFLQGQKRNPARFFSLFL